MGRLGLTQSQSKYPMPPDSLHRNMRRWYLDQISEEAHKDARSHTAIATSRAAATALGKFRVTGIILSTPSSKSTTSIIGGKSTLAQLINGPILSWVSVAYASNGKTSEDLKKPRLHDGNSDQVVQ